MTRAPRRRAAVLLGVLALAAAPLAGCGATGGDPGGDAPLPYTAEQIRASNLPPTSTVYRITGAGLDELVQTSRFVAESEDGERVTVEFAQDVPGAPERRDAGSKEFEWTALRDHARFPAVLTERAAVTVEVGAGRFRCWRYAVAQPYRNKPAVHRYWFDRDTAGSPVLYTIEQDGVEVYRMELLGHDRKPIAGA